MEKSEYTPNFENQEDHLRLMFANYFVFMKHFKERFSEQHIRDAINASLYGLDFGFNREECLATLIDGLKKITAAAEKEAQIRELNKHFVSGGEYKKEAEKPKTEAMKLEEVVEEFGLSRNNIKSKTWRDKNGFPYLQITEKGGVTYYRSKVQEWCDARKKK